MLIPLVLFAVFFYNRTVEKRELRKSYQIEEVALKIELSNNYIEQTVNLNDYFNCEEVRIQNIQIEQTVDLNDYFNSSTGWDDETDWNYTGLEDEESQKTFDKVLKKNGIYWSDQKQCWVRKVKKTVEQASKVKFR